MLKQSKYLLNFALRRTTIRNFASYKNEYLEVNEENGVKEIILNHEKTRNSLSMDMMCNIQTEMSKDLDNDKNLRCIVLGAKGHVWSAGHNLKDMIANNNPEYHKALFDKLTEIIQTIRNAPVPVIAKVNGLAAAAGCQLVASCDIIISSDKSQFSTPGANFGVFCSTPGIALARVVPRPTSSFMLLTGLPLTAQEAYTAGLVSRLVPEAELDCEMDKVIKAILHKSRKILAVGKQFYYKQIALNINEAYEQGSQVMSDTIKLDDSQEGLKSFAEKRKPQWKHN